MKNKLERIWKEAVVANFKVLLRNFGEGTEEKHEEPQDTQSSSRELNLGTHKYVIGVITFRLRFRELPS
jgi:hypothetical protein